MRKANVYIPDHGTSFNYPKTNRRNNAVRFIRAVENPWSEVPDPALLVFYSRTLDFDEIDERKRDLLKSLEDDSLLGEIEDDGDILEIAPDFPKEEKYKMYPDDTKAHNKGTIVLRRKFANENLGKKLEQGILKHLEKSSYKRSKAPDGQNILAFDIDSFDTVLEFFREWDKFMKEEQGQKEAATREGFNLDRGDRGLDIRAPEPEALPEDGVAHTPDFSSSREGGASNKRLAGIEDLVTPPPPREGPSSVLSTPVLPTTPKRRRRPSTPARAVPRRDDPNSSEQKHRQKQWLSPQLPLIATFGLAGLGSGATVITNLALPAQFIGQPVTTILWVGLGTFAFLALGTALDHALRSKVNRRRHKLKLQKTDSSSSSMRFIKGALNLVPVVAPAVRLCRLHSNSVPVKGKGV